MKSLLLFLLVLFLFEFIVTNAQSDNWKEMHNGFVNINEGDSYEIPDLRVPPKGSLRYAFYRQANSLEIRPLWHLDLIDCDSSSSSMLRSRPSILRSWISSFFNPWNKSEQPLMGKYLEWKNDYIEYNFVSDCIYASEISESDFSSIGSRIAFKCKKNFLNSSDKCDFRYELWFDDPGKYGGITNNFRTNLYMFILILVPVGMIWNYKKAIPYSEDQLRKVNHRLILERKEKKRFEEQELLLIEQEKNEQYEYGGMRRRNARV